MHVTELYALTQWVDLEIVKKQVPSKYQTLQQKLQQNTKQNQQNQPFDAEREDLLNCLRKVPLRNLSIDQLNFLETIGIAKHVGEEGAQEVEDILFRNVIDIATAASKIAEIHKAISDAIGKINQIKNGLAGTIEPETVVEDGVLIRVAFAHDAAIENVVDLKKWTTVWHDIGRGVAMVNDAAPEDVRVVGAKRGSIIFELAVIYSIAKTVSTIVLMALRVAEKVMDVRRKAAEVRAMNLNNDKIARDLEKEADDLKKESAEDIVKKVLEDTKGKAGSDGDKSVALTKAIKNLLDFLEKGGEVDCVVPDEDGTGEEAEAYAEEIAAIRATAKEIRQLEYKMKALEHDECVEGNI